MIVLSLYVIATALLFFYSRNKQIQLLQDLRKKNLLLDSLNEYLQKLRTEQEQINAIVSTMSEQVIAVKSDGTVLYLNQSAEKLLGVSNHEAKGKYFLEVVRHAPLNEILKNVLEIKEECHREIELRIPDERHLQVRAVPIALRNKEEGALLVLHDISRIHLLELVRKDFIANVSHELRTPLTTIRGTAETLLSGAISDTSVNREFIGMILSESERLSRLVEELLDLSALESGKVNLKKSFFSLEKLILEVQENMAPKAKDQEINFENKFEPNLSSIYGDRDQMKQVFLNLIDNAIKFNRKGGKVRVVALVAEGKITISIEDTGVGIPSSECPRIFERFYRVSKDRSGKLSGTGLGLAIVKHILHLHDGEIEVTSTPNTGSTFILSLPQ